MKPSPFDYEAPDSLDAALASLERHGPDAKLLAGGQSLVPLLNFRLAQPAVLVDLERVPGLDGVERAADGGLRLGAMARQRTVERHPLVAAAAPLLAEALPWVAHAQIRNRGTVGGSLAHADPAAELPALALALDGRLRVASTKGEREVAAREFYVGLLTTDLAPDEILLELIVPPSPPRTGWAFDEFARRHGDYALIGVAAGLTLGADGTVSRARIAFLSAGDTPMEGRAAARILVGERPTGEALRAAAAAAARDDVDPAGDIHGSAAYRRHLAEVLTRRTLERAAERAAAGGPARA